jgi:RNA ligase (TIGR02306 family)
MTETPEVPDNTRKLVTIRRVRGVHPIPNADNIELSLIDGWQTVTRKDEFCVGDLGVYFEIDSFLPIEDRYEFLRPSSYKQLEDGTEGFRLKTIKLRKVLSQGLLLPLELFPEIPVDSVALSCGRDVTDLLHVTKYEPPLPADLHGLVKGNFPSDIPKTDQGRIQNQLHFFTLYEDVWFEASEKVNGTSVTYYYRDGEFGVCSRNLDLKETKANSFWLMARKLDLEEKLRRLGENIAIQAELAGPKIAKNPLKLPEQQLFVFNIWNLERHCYLTPNERMQYIRVLELDHVPIIHSTTPIFQLCDTIDKLLAYAHGKSLINPAVDREGVVFKSTDLIEGQIVSFKVVDNEYLLKEKE